MPYIHKLSDAEFNIYLMEKSFILAVSIVNLLCTLYLHWESKSFAVRLENDKEPNKIFNK